MLSKTLDEAEKFYMMFSPKAVNLASHFLNEEKEEVINLMKSLPKKDKKNFIAIGGGSFPYLTPALDYAEKYIVVDPFSNIFVRDSLNLIIPDRVVIRKKCFSQIKSEDLPDGKNIFVFLFNVISYIPNPISLLKKLIKKGDVIFVSRWNMSPLSYSVFSEYYKYVNQKTIAPSFTDVASFSRKYHFNKIGEISDYKEIVKKVSKIEIINF